MEGRVFRQRVAGGLAHLRHDCVLPTNTRPDVTEVTVEPPGIVFQRPYSGDDSAVAGMTETLRRPELSDTPTSLTGKKMIEKGLQTLMWKADDADGDPLQYRLRPARGRDELASRSPAASTIPSMSGTPRRCRTAVTPCASARPTRRRTPPARRSAAFVRAKRSKSTNTPPTIITEVVRQNGAVHLHLRVHDTETPIDKVEYAIGGGAWTLVYPTDGLADSPDEAYDIPVASDADLGRLVIRASDVMRNVSTLAAERTSHVTGVMARSLVLPICLAEVHGPAASIAQSAPTELRG